MALYVYMHNLEENWGKVDDDDEDVDVDVGTDALYEIKLPSLPNSINKPPFQTELILSPILEVPMAKYPRNMGCVQFGSRLYFLGGHGHGPMGLSLNGPELYDDDTDFTDLTHRVYSRNVYFFDTNDPTSGLKECPSMSTGKPSPLIFVAHGMIYVIAGSVRRGSFKLYNHSVNRFERFNPLEGTWEVLDDSPLENISDCIFTTVFENHHKVVIFGLEFGKFFRLVYDYKHDKWDSDTALCIGEQIPYIVCHVSDRLDEEDGLCIYGFQSQLPGAPIKLGPLKDPDNLHNLCSEEISIVDTPVAWNSLNAPVEDWMHEAFYRRMGFRPTNTMHHLGDGYFCHVMTGRDCFSGGPYSDCPHTYRVSVIIFKELSSQDKHIPLSFEAKLLHIQDYEIKMASHASSQIGGILFIQPGN